MSHNKFDDEIRKKLNNITPSNMEDAWDIFEKKYEKVVPEDQNFDQNVKSVLQNEVNPKFINQHWDILKGHLVIIDQRIRAIQIAKIAEATILILILIVINNLGYDHNYQYADKTKNSVANITSSKGKVKEEKNASDALVIEKLNYSKLFSPETKALKKSNVKSYFKKEAFPVPVLSTKRIKPIKVEQRPIALTLPVKTEKFVANTSERSSPEEKMINPLDQLPSIASAIQYSEEAFQIPMEMHISQKKVRKSISAFAASDVNLINTPFDKIYAIASYNKEALNNSYGIGYSNTSKNLEVEMGLTYAQRIYQPEIYTEYFGQNGDYYFEKTLKKIRFDIVAIPLNLKYHFVNQHNWSAYLMTGLAFNIVASAKYDINEQIIVGEPPIGRFKESRLDDKNFISGVANGDAIKENYFATASVGFGIEKKILNNTYIYAQPSYQRQFLSANEGVGPNRDKIHTASLQVGVKSYFN